MEVRGGEALSPKLAQCICPAGRQLARDKTQESMPLGTYDGSEAIPVADQGTKGFWGGGLWDLSDGAIILYVASSQQGWRIRAHWLPGLQRKHLHIPDTFGNGSETHP